MMRSLGIVGLLVFAAMPAWAAAPDELIAYARTQLGHGYLTTGDCAPASRPGWPDGLITRCVYSVTDKADGKLRKAAVWTADPSPERIAAWSWTACERAAPDMPLACARKTVDQIRIVSSSGHFPVAGVVYEDICDFTLPPGKHCTHGNGINEVWTFKDGVTTRLAGFGSLNGTEMWPGAGEDPVALSDRIADAAAIGMATGKVRPMAIEPADFAKASGRTDVPTDISAPDGATAWLAIVRELYVPALSSDENPFVTAAACLQYQHADAHKCFMKPIGP